MQPIEQNTNNDKNIISVSDLNRYLEGKFAHDENLRNLTLKGEVSNFTNHLKSGHYYFSLKDDKSSIRAIMYKTQNAKVKFQVKDGMNLIVTGTVTVFPRDGTCQINCTNLEPDGIGGLHLAFEQLKEKLGEKDYFNPKRKKPLPQLPKNIGIVTSPTGAALQDILNILDRRYPLAEVTIFPTLVQGESAANSIADNIQKAQTHGAIDVLIVGRGGGSIEDLWSFNEEVVADAIFRCSIPVISAVGHEVDYTISDMVADTRAPTPSAAAEIVAPDIRNIYSSVCNMRQKLEELIQMRVYTNYQNIIAVYNRLKANSPENKLDLALEQVQSKSLQLDSIIDRIITVKENQMVNSVSKMEALSPLKVLTRGYSITYDEKGSIVSEAEQVSAGDKIVTKLSNGEITSIVQ